MMIIATFFCQVLLSSYGSMKRKMINNMHNAHDAMIEELFRVFTLREIVRKLRPG